VASDRQPAGRTEAYEERGVWVPNGLSVDEVMTAAAALERKYDFDPYTARSIVRTVLLAIRSGKQALPECSEVHAEQQHVEVDEMNIWPGFDLGHRSGGQSTRLGSAPESVGQDLTARLASYVSAPGQG